MNKSQEFLNKNAQKINEIINEVAVRTGTVISKDDPILVQYALNELLLEQMQLKQQRLLEEFRANLEEVYHRQLQEAEEKAQKLFDSALSASKSGTNKEIERGVRLMTQTLQNELDAATSQLAKPLTQARKASFLNVITAALAATASIIIVWALW